MKRNILCTVFFILVYHFSFAQAAPYNVVIDVTSPDTLVHKMVMRWVSEITSSRPDANVEVVLFAKSLDMVTQGKSVVASDVVKYGASKNVAFKVCQQSLKNNAMDASALITGVGTVPDGIYEIISRQHDGWGYIKAAR